MHNQLILLANARYAPYILNNFFLELFCEQVNVRIQFVSSLQNFHASIISF